MFFDTFVPSDEQLNTCRHIELTSDQEWDPAAVRMQLSRRPSRARIVQQMQRETRRLFEAETDQHLTGISETYCPDLFAQRLIESVWVESRQDVDEREKRYINEVKTNKRHSTVTPEHISRVFGIGLNAAKQTIQVTTQKGVRHAIHPLNRRYRMDHLDLHRDKLKGKWYTDFLLAQKKSINQKIGAWIFTNGHFTEAYPVDERTSAKAATALSSFCTDVGTPENLKSDRVKELVGRNTEFHKYARKRHINLTYPEPYRKNQIWSVDLEMRELKKRVRNKMVRRNIPGRVWAG